MQGLIINAQKNLYSVKYNDQEILCFLTGKVFKEKENKSLKGSNRNRLGNTSKKEQYKDSNNANTKSLVVIGDIVEFDILEDNKGLITNIYPRKTKFSRQGIGVDANKEQIIAANIDQIVIVCSVHEPRYKLNGIDRYIVSAKAGGIEPIVCFNKIDMIDISNIQADIDNYQKNGIKTLVTSSYKNIGMDNLKEILKDKITVFSGSSGVGKSSLVNSLFDQDIAKTSDISLTVKKGRHTTSSSNLYDLPFGGMILDTPGMRQFGLFESDEQVENTFEDVTIYAENCKFKNCRHINEPSCAVKEAVESGEISSQRYKSYLKLRK